MGGDTDVKGSSTGRPERQPLNERVTEALVQWIDPVAEDQELTRFVLCPQRTRDRGKGEVQGSYQIYLPPSYDTDTSARYPVIYWLHAAWGSSRDGAGAVRVIDAAIRSGTMPECIVVVPQALPIGWYVDSKDGARLTEQTVAGDLVRHVDGNFRTIASPGSRTIEGYEMGGYGALRIAFKYPKVFANVSAIAPLLVSRLDDLPEALIRDTFYGDQQYFDAVGPATYLLANSPEIRNHLKVRVVSSADEQDPANLLLRERLKALNIRSEWIDTAPIESADYESALVGLGSDYPRFWHP